MASTSEQRNKANLNRRRFGATSNQGSSSSPKGQPNGGVQGQSAATSPRARLQRAKAKSQADKAGKKVGKIVGATALGAVPYVGVFLAPIGGWLGGKIGKTSTGRLIMILVALLLFAATVLVTLVVIFSLVYGFCSNVVTGAVTWGASFFSETIEQTRIFCNSIK